KDVDPDWDLTLATIRKFQSTFIQSLSKVLNDRAFKIMLGHMIRYSVSFSNYFTQYIDQLNLRFFHWDKDKRLKNLSIMAKRIAEQGKEYQQVKKDVLQVAHQHNCHVNEI